MKTLPNQQFGSFELIETLKNPEFAKVPCRKAFRFYSDESDGRAISQLKQKQRGERTSPIKVIATILEALILGKLTSGDRVIFFLFKDLIINKQDLLIIKRAKTTEIR